jgi:maleate cis-trans isomerase
MKRVTAISPYTEAVDEAEHRFFAEGGIEAIAGAHLGIVDGFRLAEPDAEAILDLAASAWDPQSDGLIAACLNFRSHLVIDNLQARIGKPAVTSTQAVLAPISACRHSTRRSTASASFCERISTRGSEDRSGENDPTARSETLYNHWAYS